jgi:hypothetical protein
MWLRRQYIEVVVETSQHLVLLRDVPDFAEKPPMMTSTEWAITERRQKPFGFQPQT